MQFSKLLLCHFLVLMAIIFMQKIKKILWVDSEENCHRRMDR